MEFLGRKHGYIPEGAEEQANCLQLALNAADIWAECYPARQSEDEGKEYTETRLPKWLSTLELFHDKTSGGGACEYRRRTPHFDSWRRSLLTPRRRLLWRRAHLRGLRAVERALHSGLHVRHQWN